MSFVVSTDKGVVHFKGEIDDTARFGAISSMSGKATINLRGVTSVNSVGVRHYLEFIATWKGLKVTYEECPHVLVDAFIMLPSLLGPTENTATIQSFEVTYDCTRCKDSHDLYVKADDLHLKDRELVFPVRVCPACAGFLKIQASAAQLVELVELGALKVKASK